MNIELHELAALLRGSNTPVKTEQPVIEGQHIAVLDRGFVYVGDIEIKGDFLYISNAKNIRYWGTKNGLGELRKGPLAETKLDKVGDVIAPMKSLIHLVPCNGF